MTSIDEAIAHAEELAKRNREQWKNCPADRRDIEHQTCEQCAEEHEQIADWLEELKAYQQQHFKLCEKYGVNTIEDLYDKAIDDFVKFANTMPTVEAEDGEVRPMWLEEMEEKLKAGVLNGED